MKFRKKPVVIEAFKYDGDLINSSGEDYVPDWAEEAHKKGILFFDDGGRDENPMELYVKTLEGNMLVSIGDYVIKGVAGELYPCKPDIFEKTYEAVTE